MPKFNLLLIDYSNKKRKNSSFDDRFRVGTYAYLNRSKPGNNEWSPSNMLRVAQGAQLGGETVRRPHRLFSPCTRSHP